MTVEDLKKYKDNLYNALSRDLSEFEKNFLLITSGVLAFTITFIKDIVKIEISSNLWLLFLSWFLFCLALGLIMYTFLSSSKSSDKIWKCVDDFLIKINKFDDKELLLAEEALEIKKNTNEILYESKKKLSKFRYIAIYCFISGITSLSIFVSLNIMAEKKNKEKDKKITTIIIGETEVKTKDSIIKISTYGKR